MSEDKDKIKIPEDFPGQGNGDGQTKPNSSIEKDPEVLAEIKKNKLLHLKLERWKETAGALGVVLQTFKAEAMSLTSGIGTLVLGWFQIRKMVVRGRAETKAEGRREGTAEGRVAGRAAERAERREDRREARTGASDRTTGAGEGYGSGSGRAGVSHAEAKPPKPVKPKPVSSSMPPPPPPGGELMPPPIDVSSPSPLAAYLDPMNYVTVFVPVIFIWSSVVAWLKRKKKIQNKEAGHV